MSQTKILLDSNAYFRLAQSIHPLFLLCYCNRREIERAEIAIHPDCPATGAGFPDTQDTFRTGTLACEGMRLESARAAAFFS